ncbi:hypothetical protein [Noviherbaspirillum aridicola]|uniref:Uncharacterized protein n=1 Tax=Noviherbaspirillum aridicola TaxID=2849687 RepID=A0ABQ4Q2R8_9BURK|nr:hypothetical protein [Noviherbaspirillum aridicola]GIZ51100.1 hypothetical protein NCCP691_11140 [Noviherbaspirillum aridicola]
MGRTGRRAQERKRKNTIVIGLLGCVVVAAGGAMAYVALTTSEGIDPVTLCPNTGPTSHTIVLVDKSDPMSFTQRKDFDVVYEEIIRKRVPKGGLLSVYALEEDFKDNADPVAERCNPGDGSDVDIKTGNPERARKIFKEKYLDPMVGVADDLTTDRRGKASPIFEMLQLVSIGFRKHDVRGERELIVFSDMLHNTPGFSMYKDKRLPKFSEFAESSYGARAMTDLQGAKVELQILMHTPQLQKKELAYFWEEYVYKAKGKVTAVNAIKG